jgi:hypothetical protein
VGCTWFDVGYGPASLGTVDLLPGRGLRVIPLSPAHENGTVPLHIEGPPHSLIRMGTLLLAASPPPIVRTLGWTNAAGVLNTSITLGSFAPGVEAQIASYQFYYVQPEIPKVRRIGQPLNDVVLGQATMLIGLDESF